MLQTLLETAGELVNQYGLTVGVTAVFVSLMYSLVLYFPKRNSGEQDMGYMRKRAEYESAVRRRRLTENKAVEEMITDGLLQLLADDRLSPEGYDNWQRRLATAFGLKDLSPARLSTTELKTALKTRRNGGSYHGLYKPVFIPGPKPGEKEGRKLNALELMIHRQHIR